MGEAASRGWVPVLDWGSRWPVWLFWVGSDFGVQCVRASAAPAYRAAGGRAEPDRQRSSSRVAPWASVLLLEAAVRQTFVGAVDCAVANVRGFGARRLPPPSFFAVTCAMSGSECPQETSVLWGPYLAGDYYCVEWWELVWLPAWSAA
ncbi:hypothetical protein NDU88_007581 [Pleurodeles waltl]|uniref:Uncharacterized protein n=1 Tax=Pleurodeles waltl TaxID=8319 RepID=A0AAV7RSA8_PLEWA|nr:hypothetical protein NDU88_007581 [Pleurodeles waltl]